MAARKRTAAIADEAAKAAEAEAAEVEAMLLVRKRERANRRRARAARLRLIGETLGSGWHWAMRDLGGLAGIGLLSWGAGQTYAPAGYMVLGFLLLAGAWIAGTKDSGS